MGYLSRAYEPELSIHVIQRGTDRLTVFRQDLDHEVFIVLLKRAAGRWLVAVHAYVLMSNHFHLIVTPSTSISLSRMMQYVDGMYARYFNRTYERTGTLWSGRYRSIVISDENYWLTCLRYVELNPVRASLVERPEEYPWSSYRTHAFGANADWLTLHPVYKQLGTTPEQRQAAYQVIAAEKCADFAVRSDCVLAGVGD